MCRGSRCLARPRLRAQHSIIGQPFSNHGPPGSAATSVATRACSARLYSTRGGQARRGVSEFPAAQAVKKIVAAARAARGCVQHLAVNGIVTLQLV